MEVILNPVILVRSLFDVEAALAACSIGAVSFPAFWALNQQGHIPSLLKHLIIDTR
jgi:hypothetical protein